MAPPRIEKIITALDVGSWKVCALIAGQTADGQLHVLGTGQRESRGVQRGYVADMEQTEHIVREAIEQAERIAGLNIADVWVSRSEEHTSELQSLMRISYAVFCLKKNTNNIQTQHY